MRKSALLLLAACTLATPAVAGEVNGKGEPIDVHGASICAFSGQNDGNPPPGRVQSFGQNVRGGFVDPTDNRPEEEDEFHPHPGWSCNPNTWVPPEF